MEKYARKKEANKYPVIQQHGDTTARTSSFTVMCRDCKSFGMDMVMIRAVIQALYQPV